jgi:hypothetical protein
MQNGFGHPVMQPAFAPSFQQPIATPTYGYGQPASLPPSFAQPASLPPSVTRKMSPLCQHIGPYRGERAVTKSDFFNPDPKADPGLNNPAGLQCVDFYIPIEDCFDTVGSCTGCDQQCMLVNGYLPLTKIRLDNDGTIFDFGHSTWKNALCCKNIGDILRTNGGVRVQVPGRNGWFMFWVAVHYLWDHLYDPGRLRQLSMPKKEGLQRQRIYESQQVSAEQVEQWEGWIRRKAKTFPEQFKKYLDAGLLDVGGQGDGNAGVRDKFMRAQHLLRSREVYTLIETRYSNTQTGVSCWEPPPRQEYAEQFLPQQQQQQQQQQQAEELLQEAPSKQLHHGDEQVYGQTDAMPAQAQQAHAIIYILHNIHCMPPGGAGGARQHPRVAPVSIRGWRASASAASLLIAFLALLILA